MLGACRFLLLRVAHLGVFATASSCGGSAPSEPQTADVAPRYVTVSLIDSTIAPSKLGGAPWDGFGRVPETLTSRIAAALTTQTPHAGVLAALADPLMQGIAKPEPIGTAELMTGGAHGQPVELKFSGQRDTCTPEWDGPPTWTHVELSPAVRLRVRLIDKDFSADDPIGSFELGEADFRAALQGGHILQVPVGSRRSSRFCSRGSQSWARARRQTWPQGADQHAPEPADVVKSSTPSREGPEIRVQGGVVPV